MKNHYLKLLESFAATNPVAFLTEEEIEWLLNQQFNINEKPVWELPS